MAGHARASECLANGSIRNYIALLIDLQRHTLRFRMAGKNIATSNTNNTKSEATSKEQQRDGATQSLPLLHSCYSWLLFFL